VLGLYQCPTIVNNVETLCHVKHIADMGGEAYAKIGTPNNTGTRIFCVSGHVQKPGYYEFEVGKITMGQLLNEVCGGPRPGRKFKAVIPGGSSAKILRFGERFKGKRKVGRDGRLRLGRRGHPDGFRLAGGMIGTMGGSGGVIVMDDSVNMVEALANINAFYAHESCGQCTPCREGSLWMKKITARMVHGDARPRTARCSRAWPTRSPAAPSAPSARPAPGRPRASSRSSATSSRPTARPSRPPGPPAPELVSEIHEARAQEPFDLVPTLFA
jgi:NADH-quinone oxidoreductase subunit F